MTSPTWTESRNGTGPVEIGTEADRAVEAYRSARPPKIAVIGMAARLPGARNFDDFWALLEARDSGLRRIGADDLEAAGVPVSRLDEPGYVPVWGGPEGADGFDTGFFGYTPHEAEVLDPQQRVFLECAWHALEDAGHDGARVPDRIGVFAAASLSSHLLRAAGRADPLVAGLSNIDGMVAARTSFHLDLKGPSIGVQTTCSSSVVAIHQAIQSLLSGQCDMALAGAVAVNQVRPEGYVFQEGGIAAPDGVCRPFDAAAAGTVFANGAGVVVLKPLDAALADGDTVHGVLAGSAVNNDGAMKISLTAPSVGGQAAVLSAALKAAHLDASAIDYVEAHGTGTALGDPIEVTALNRSYGPGLQTSGRRCGLGSVKGNVGHLDAAAGMAGLFKILLAFRKEVLPGTANLTSPSPKCSFGSFDLLGEGRAWPRDPARVRRAGLSSFGIGGTNAHLIVEEPPLTGRADTGDDGPQLLPLSARSDEALARLRSDLAAALDRTDAPGLGDTAFTLQTGRRGFVKRQVIVARDTAEAARALRRDADSAEPLDGKPNIVFLFPGQGSQRAGMARDLHAAEPAFRAALDACLDAMPDGGELRGLLLDPDDASGRIHQTRLTQPALFAVEYALARLWMARGIEPVAMVGHSIGEYVAACIAGVFDLDTAARLVSARGRLMQDCEPGAMLAVMISEAEARAALPEGVEIAAINGPRATVLAGDRAVIADMAERFDRSGMGCRMLDTSHAFHTSAMDPALDAFRKFVGEVTLNAPAISILSNVTGDWMTEEQACDPGYWVSQLRQPVRYGDCVAQLAPLDNLIALEVGPGAGLGRLARQQLPSGARSIASLPDAGAKDGAAEVLRATGALWMAGADPDWTALHDGPRRRVSLPGYPFEHRTCWLPPAVPCGAPAADFSRPESWLYQPVWTRLPAGQRREPGRMVVFGAKALRTALGSLPDGWIAVERSDGACETRDDGFAIDPREPEHYRALLAALDERGVTVDGFVSAWGLGERGEGVGDLYPGTVALAQALAGAEMKGTLTIVGAGICEVTGSEALDPSATMALGLLRVLPQEVPGLDCRVIDLDPAEIGGAVRGLHAALGPTRETVLALRGGYLWTARHDPAPLDPAPRAAQQGPYLVIGSVPDGLSLAYARAVRETMDAPLIVAGQGVPAPADWDNWIARHEAQDPMSVFLSTLRDAGGTEANVLVLDGDTSDAGWLGEALDTAEARFGPLAGVFFTGAMGDSTFCPLDQLDDAVTEAIVADKLRGLTALRTALKGRSPAFCLVQSSLSVLTGGPGWAAYAAANAWIEAETALARRDPGETVWQSIAWDVAETSSYGPEAARLSKVRVLTGAEVWDATQSVLAHPGVGHAVVTPGSLEARIKTAATPAQAETEAPAERPSSTPYVAPRDDYESAVAAVMSEMMGLRQVGAEDNFFELGGHSLLAIQIINRLRRDFDVELPVRAILYEAPTVAGVAQALKAAREAAADEIDTLGRLLDEVEEESGARSGVETAT